MNGYGKSSLAQQLRVRLAGDALAVIASGTAPQIAEQLGRELGVDLTSNLVEALVVAVKQHRKGRVAPRAR